MKVGIHTGMVDGKTNKIGFVLRDVFKVIGAKLENNYGGTMQHLWIDFELIESHAKPDGSPRYPFRFAKRASGRSRFGLPPVPDYFNVGHFSVRPDFHYLLSITEQDVIPYCLNLIYKELDILKAKEKKLGGFNANLFKNRFFEECKNVGYTLNSN